MRNALAKRGAVIVATGALVLATPSASFAEPTTYFFEQTSTTAPGFEPSATITINGTFADLPTITNVGAGFDVINPGPYDFGNLLGLSLEYPSAGGYFPLVSYDFSNFVMGNTFGTRGILPRWLISPENINYYDGDLGGFSFTLSSEASITVGGPNGNFLCAISGGCVADGEWVPIPEPSSLSVLIGAFGLAWATFYFRRKKPTHRPRILIAWIRRNLMLVSKPPPVLAKT